MRTALRWPNHWTGFQDQEADEVPSSWHNGFTNEVSSLAFSYWEQTSDCIKAVSSLWPIAFVYLVPVSYDITVIQVFALFEMETTSCTRGASCITINYNIDDKSHKYQLCMETPDTVLGNVCWTLHTVSTPKTIMFLFGKPGRAKQQMCQQKSLDGEWWPFAVGGCAVESELQFSEGGKMQNKAILWYNELEVRNVYRGSRKEQGYWIYVWLPLWKSPY